MKWICPVTVWTDGWVEGWVDKRYWVCTVDMKYLYFSIRSSAAAILANTTVCLQQLYASHVFRGCCISLTAGYKIRPGQAFRFILDIFLIKGKVLLLYRLMVAFQSDDSHLRLVSEHVSIYTKNYACCVQCVQNALYFYLAFEFKIDGISGLSSLTVPSHYLKQCWLIISKLH